MADRNHLISRLPLSLQSFFRADKNGDLWLDKKELRSSKEVPKEWLNHFSTIDSIGIKDGHLAPDEILHYERISGKSTSWRQSITAYQIWKSARLTKATDHPHTMQLAYITRHLMREKGMDFNSIESIFDTIEQFPNPEKRFDVMEKLYEICNLLPEKGLQEVRIAGRTSYKAPLEEEFFQKGIGTYLELFQSKHGDDLINCAKSFFKEFRSIDLISKGLQKQITIWSSRKADPQIQKNWIDKILSTGCEVDDSVGRVDLFTLYRLSEGRDSSTDSYNRRVPIPFTLDLPNLITLYQNKNLRDRFLELQLLLMVRIAATNSGVAVEENKINIENLRKYEAAMLTLLQTLSPIQIADLVSIDDKEKKYNTAQAERLFSKRGVSIISYADKIGVIPEDNSFRRFLLWEAPEENPNRVIEEVIDQVRFIRAGLPPFLSFNFISNSAIFQKIKIYSEAGRILYPIISAAGLNDDEIIHQLTPPSCIEDLYNTRNAGYSSLDQFLDKSRSDLSEALISLRDNFGVKTELLWPTLLTLLGDKNTILERATSFQTFLATAKRWGWSLKEVQSFCFRMNQQKIDIGEVASLLSKSQYDRLTISSPRSADDFGDLILRVSKKCNQISMSYLSLKVLDALDIPFRPHLKRLSIDVAAADWNGSIHTLHALLEKFIDQGYDLDLQMALYKSDIFHHAKKANQGSIHVQLVVGHADNTGFVISVNEESLVKKDLNKMKIFIKPKLASNSVVIYDGCSTAKREGNVKDFATSTAEVLHTVVWGNSTDGTVEDIDFDDHGNILRVKFYGENNNTSSGRKIDRRIRVRHH